MSPRPSLNRRKRAVIRVDDANVAHLEAQAKSERFNSVTAYVNWLITQDRTGRDQSYRDLEERLSATVLRLSREIQATQTSVEVGSAFLHSVVKMLLVNMPEADATTKKVGQATAQSRYQKLLSNAAEQMQDQREEHGAKR